MDERGRGHRRSRRADRGGGVVVTHLDTDTLKSMLRDVLSAPILDVKLFDAITAELARRVS